MRVSIIVAIDQHNGIGNGNKLLVHLPEDLGFFKRTTMGHHIVMGRNTYESIGRPLAGRTMVVLTRNAHYALPEGVVRADSLRKGIDLCQGDEEVFVIGGASVYQQAIHSVDRLIVTRIDAVYEADAFFPRIDQAVWQREAEGEWRESKSGVRFRVEIYTRR